MGYSPQLWGREAWHFIHFVALTYPNNPTEEDKINYGSFVKSLQFVLPCPSCSENYKVKLNDHPPRMDSKREFFEWTVDIHNMVNAQNGKKQLSYEEAIDELKQNTTVNKLMILKKTLSFTISAAATILLFTYVLSRKTK